MPPSYPLSPVPPRRLSPTRRPRDVRSSLPSPPSLDNRLRSHRRGAGPATSLSWPSAVVRSADREKRHSTTVGHVNNNCPCAPVALNEAGSKGNGGPTVVGFSEVKTKTERLSPATISLARPRRWFRGKIVFCCTYSDLVTVKKKPLCSRVVYVPRKYGAPATTNESKTKKQKSCRAATLLSDAEY